MWSCMIRTPWPGVILLAAEARDLAEELLMRAEWLEAEEGTHGRRPAGDEKCRALYSSIMRVRRDHIHMPMISTVARQQPNDTQ